MRDREKSNERSRRWRLKQKIAKYGEENAHVSMIGKHGNHARGRKNGRWNGGLWTHQLGYLAIKVPNGHHLRMKNGYAYVHQIEAEKMLGRRLTDSETVHHIDGDVTNNNHDNLMVLSRSDHARIHAIAATRSALGQFVRGLKRIDLRVREFPR